MTVQQVYIWLHPSKRNRFTGCEVKPNHQVADLKLVSSTRHCSFQDQNFCRMAVLRYSSLPPIQRPIGLSTLEVFQKPSPNFAIVETSLHSAYRSSRLSASSATWRSKGQLGQLQRYKSVSSTRLSKKGGKSRLVIEALQGAGRPPRRLVEVIRAIPRLSRTYFKSPFRRALYGGISLLGGFYVAQTISLSFGALGVNDVIAAALCVLFAEYVTRFYYTRKKAQHIVGVDYILNSVVGIIFLLTAGKAAHGLLRSFRLNMPKSKVIKGSPGKVMMDSGRRTE